jgi:DNA repair protein SbcC/Rad50
MIPIRLTLQGIYSYQDRQTIDFTRLTEANIFGIFGTVGSGKSTILEAITFALYGNTDRLNQRDDRNYNMMNLKSNELFIEFDFKTGRSDSEYRATVKGRRNSKKFSDVKTLDRAAYKWVNNEWQPVETEQLETVIGLSYENFKRTVIIPQGRFQEFLQLGNTDRTRMMKELFNLDKYELYYKVVSLEGRTNQQLQNLEGQLQQLGEIHPEQIQAIEVALGELIKTIGTLTTERTRQQNLEEALRKLKELTAKIVESEQTVFRLKTQEPEFAGLEKTIQEYEYCLLNFRSELDVAKELSAKISELENSLHSDDTLQKSIKEQLSELIPRFETLKKSYENREELRQQAEELNKIKQINQLAEKNLALNKRIQDGDTVYAETLQKINTLTEAQEQVAASIKVLKEGLPDMIRLSDAKSWFTTQAALLASGKEIGEELLAVKKGLQQIEDQRIQLLENDCFSRLERPCAFQEMETALEQQKTELRASIHNVDDTLRHLSVQSKLEEYAANLEEGLPCPLCGALSHPEPLDGRHVSEELAQMLQHKKNLEAEVKAVELLEKQLAGLLTTLRLKQEQQAKVLQKQQDHTVSMTNHQQLSHWKEYPEEKTVTEAFATAVRLQQQLKAKELEQETVSKNLVLENQNKEKFGKGLEDLRRQKTAGETEITTLSNQIKLLRLADYEGKPDDVLTHDIEALLRTYREVEETYQSVNQTINELQKQADTLAGSIQANSKTLELERQSQKSVHAKLQLKLDQSKYASLPEVEQILTQSIQLDKEKQRVTDFRQMLEVAEKQLLALRLELGDRHYSEDEYRQLFDSLRELTEKISLSNQEQGKLEEELRMAKANLDAQKTLLEKTNSLQLRAEEIKTLKQLFKGSGFVNYVSSVYLQELCHAATERFYKLTNQRLSLEITDDNNFQVRDFINGGKVRNVKTLSGGQTFQAALSLALALADNIQQITESKQNFFFLDEGFGSLDKESLDIVFDTLKSLRKENRIVGVISHVEEMQQEIDTHLRIVNEEERGSRIVASWNSSRV